MTVGVLLSGCHVIETLRNRFWAKVDTSAGASACWPWKAFRLRNGYGTIGVGGRAGGKEMAHRAAWILTNGPIPAGMFVCHTCDNPPCVNPAHLFLGTPADNMRDMRTKGRQRFPGAPGVRNAKAKLDELGVIRIFELKLAGRTQKQIAELLCVSQPSVSGVLRGATWSHLGIAPIRKFTRRATAV